MALPADYESRSAGEKRDLLWAELAGAPYADGPLPREVPGPLPRLKLYSVDYDKGSFAPCGDELPPERTKLVHTWGSCAVVQWKAAPGTPYTGFFAAGGEAIARFSDAKGNSGSMPSIALKFFVDGLPSKNLLTLPADVRAPGDRRLFSSPLSNASPPARALDTKAVQWAFERTSKALGGSRLHAVYLPLHHLAGHDERGPIAAAHHVPDRVEFHATAAVRDLDATGDDFRAVLARIPAGTPLFEVRLAPSIDAPATSAGEVVLVRPWLASRYGDERLFFSHDVGPTGAH
jgi:hypothetical protein